MSALPKKINYKFNEQASQPSKAAIHIVEADNPQSVALFKKAYQEIYEEAFFIPEERENFETLLKNMTASDAGLSVIAIIGDKLDTPTPAIKGIVIGDYYINEDVGSLAYTATSPKHRNQGLGRLQVEVIGQALLNVAKSRGGKLKGFFLECNDPVKVRPEEDSIDPAVRIKRFQKWGAKIMPIDYIQPALGKDTGKNKNLLLLAYPHPETGEYPAPDGIKAFVKGIYAVLAKYASCAPHEDPDYVDIMRQISALKPKPPTPPGHTI